jgi:hypothetical protein
MTEQAARATPIPRPGITTPVHDIKAGDGMSDKNKELTSYSASTDATYSPSRITGRLTQPPGNWSSQGLARESDNGDGGYIESHCVVVVYQVEVMLEMYGVEDLKKKYRR